MLDEVSGVFARLHKLIGRLLPHRENGSCAHSADGTGCGEVETEADEDGGAFLPRDVGKALTTVNFGLNNSY